MNMAYMGLDLRDPISVQATTSGHDKDYYPSWSKITYEFAERGGRPAIKLFWYDGKQLPSEEVVGGPVPESGCIVIGEKGKLFTGGDYGADMKLTGVEEPSDVKFVESPGHFAEWVRAIKAANRPFRTSPITPALERDGALGQSRRVGRRHG